MHSSDAWRHVGLPLERMSDKAQKTHDAILCAFTKHCSVNTAVYIHATFIEPYIHIGDHPMKYTNKFLSFINSERGWAVHWGRAMSYSYTVHSTALCVTAILELSIFEVRTHLSPFRSSDLLARSSAHMHSFKAPGRSSTYPHFLIGREREAWNARCQEKER